MADESFFVLLFAPRIELSNSWFFGVFITLNPIITSVGLVAQASRHNNNSEKFTCKILKTGDRWHHPLTMRRDHDHRFSRILFFFFSFHFSSDFIIIYLFLLYFKLNQPIETGDSSFALCCEQIRAPLTHFTSKINKYKFVVFIEPYLLPTHDSRIAYTLRPTVSTVSRRTQYS